MEDSARSGGKCILDPCGTGAAEVTALPASSRSTPGSVHRAWGLLSSHPMLYGTCRASITSKTTRGGDVPVPIRPPVGAQPTCSAAVTPLCHLLPSWEPLGETGKGLGTPELDENEQASTSAHTQHGNQWEGSGVPKLWRKQSSHQLLLQAGGGALSQSNYFFVNIKGFSKCLLYVSVGSSSSVALPEGRCAGGAAAAAAAGGAQRVG